MAEGDQQKETALEKVISTTAGTPAVTGQKQGVEEENDHHYPGPAKLTVIMLALYISVFLIALDRTIIGVAIPEVCFFLGEPS